MHIQQARVELRSNFAELELYGNPKLPKIRGYAAVFNRISNDLGGFRELILPGAFSRTLYLHRDVVCTVNHDWHNPLAGTRMGTLQLREDVRGLFFTAQAEDTRAAQKSIALIERGDVRGTSFSFQVDRPHGERWTTKDGRKLRQLVSVRLLEVAICVDQDPAYGPDEIKYL